MSDKITLYIVRHGKTLMNMMERVQGWCDSPLVQEGIDAARFLGYGLSDIHFRTAYCSDLRRAKQTARIILGAKGQDDIPLIELPGLREICFGSFEAGHIHTMWRSAALYMHYKSAEEMSKDVLDGKISYRHVLGAINEIDTMGMAETFADVEARTQETLREIAKNESRNGEANILIVSHAMSILTMLLGLGGDKLFKKPLENASVCKVIYQNGEFTVETLGDMSFVEKGKRV